MGCSVNIFLFDFVHIFYDRKWIMTNKKDILNILYDYMIKEKSVTFIADKYNVHRNTVTNIYNRNELSKEKILELKQKYDDFIITDSDLEHIFRIDKIVKVSPDDLRIIENCCKKNLNCYLTPDHLCYRLAEKYNVGVEYVINYNPRKMDFEFVYKDIIGYQPFKAKREYMIQVRKIRDKTHPPKNYEEVFYSYYKGKRISYQSFYNYARNYWDEYAMDFWEEIQRNKLTFGQYLDKYYYYDFNDKKIKKLE